MDQVVITCDNPEHEHAEDGTAMTCPDCGEPSHYDYHADEHQHDNTAAPDCFLTTRTAGASACFAQVA